MALGATFKPRVDVLYLSQYRPKRFPGYAHWRQVVHSVESTALSDVINFCTRPVAQLFSSTCSTLTLSGCFSSSLASALNRLSSSCLLALMTTVFFLSSPMRILGFSKNDSSICSSVRPEVSTPKKYVSGTKLAHTMAQIQK